MKSDIGRKVIESKARTTAGQYNVNTETLYSIPIPLPTSTELKQIVEICNDMSARCNQLEENSSNSLHMIETLESSILAQAFQGKLVD